MGRLIKIGLTGGIATGKSTVANIFKRFGIPVINSDEAAREVVVPGTEGYKKVVEAFGKEILLPNGEINRKKLAEIIFSNPEKKKKLEEILHPLIDKDIQQKLQVIEEQGQKLVVLEVPLLFEKGWDKRMHYTVTVTAPLELQIERLTQRDKIDRKEALKRIKNQMPLEEKIKRSHFVIDNSQGPKELEEQVKRILKRITHEDKGRGNNNQG